MKELLGKPIDTANPLFKNIKSSLKGELLLGVDVDETGQVVEVRTPVGISGKLIDKSDAAFQDVPESLNGEVLLEVTSDGKGNFSGYLTAPVAKIQELKGKTLAKREAEGYGKYDSIVDSLLV